MSAYPRRYPGHWLLGPSCPPTACGLVACSPPSIPPARGEVRAVDGLLRSVCSLCVTLGRCFTPGSTIEWIPCAVVLTRPENRSLLGLPSLLLADVNQRWQGLHDDASNTSLLALSIVTCLGRHHVWFVAYPLSFPLSTIENQSHAEGKCLPSSTRRVGVDDLGISRYAYLIAPT